MDNKRGRIDSVGGISPRATVRSELPANWDESTALPLKAIAEFLHSAECEIAAFRTAVVAAYGAVQAELAVMDWLREMEEADWSNPEAIPDWRSFTLAAADKLADRVCPI
jgi:hypothetical protein